MISANGGLPAHRYTPQVTPRWPRGSEPASEQKILCENWPDSSLQVSIKHFMCNLLDEMELVRSVGHRS